MWEFYFIIALQLKHHFQPIFYKYNERSVMYHIKAVALQLTTYPVTKKNSFLNVATLFCIFYLYVSRTLKQYAAHIEVCVV